LSLFRDDRRLSRGPLRPRTALHSSTPLAQIWNRIGGLLSTAGHTAGLSPAALLAVWCIECGDLPFRRGRPVLRFEPHVFFARWGSQHDHLFDAHFRFGGRLGVEGAKWQGHMMRTNPHQDWQRFHGDQAAEYQALALATRLSDPETARQCASIGGPQIMGFNHQSCGYDSASAMFEAFSRAERWQVLAFFDFCAAKALLEKLRMSDWTGFATVYNGPGNAAAYAARIGAAHDEANSLLAAGGQL
jgi:hypothetical protein